MHDRNTVLAILELDAHPDRLVERAIWIAQALECDMHLMLFAPETENVARLVSYPEDDIGILGEIRRWEESVTSNYADAINKAGIAVETSVIRARPLGDYVLELADKVRPRVVVKAAEYHSEAERSILVDADWQLMRTCPYPLWLVKSDTIPEVPVVTAAVDPGHSHDKPAALDNEIVSAAKHVAGATNGTVNLVHAYELLADLGTAATWAVKAHKLNVDEIEAKMTAAHRTTLYGLAEGHGIDKSDAHMLPGKAHDVLPAFARSQKTDIFVMGALSRWGLKRRVLGSTAERVIDHLPCDTLIVHLGEYPIGD